jgi:hypothetical protein
VGRRPGRAAPSSYPAAGTAQGARQGRRHADNAVRPSGSGARPTAVTLTFHPELTVIAGLQAEEREGLIGELLGGRAGFRRDSRIDVVDDAGRQLSVRRGQTADRDSVVEVGTARPVSDEFRHLTRLDLLQPLGLDLIGPGGAVG